MKTSEKNQTNRRQLWQIEKMKSIIEERWEEVQVAVESRDFKRNRLSTIRHLINPTLKE